MSASIGVCVLPEPAVNAPRTVRYPTYIYEILDHAGLCYKPLTFADLPAALDSDLKLLLTVGEHTFPDALKTALSTWVSAGGAWLSLSGVCGMDEVLGVRPLTPTFQSWGGSLRSMGEGYLNPTSDYPILGNLSRPLHYFGGISVQETKAKPLVLTRDMHGNPSRQPALLEHVYGMGHCLLITPDLTGTVVHIQQGIAVTRDGIPAPDGTAPLNDGVLKSDDGQVLDWLLDRAPVPGADGLKAFLQPIADQWRELLLRSIFYLAQQSNIPVTLLWYYPDNLPALGHISLDSDGNEPQQAQVLLKVLKQAQIEATWCIILPGYASELISAIEENGHELAMHYDAMSNGRLWSEEHFEEQWQQLCALFGHRPLTNKNHYLRWQGDVEFFEWCIARGILIDQSKGASKTGEAGFNFGTCHPYRPIAPQNSTLPNSVLPIYELPTPTQDFRIFAPPSLLAPLLESVLQQHGILHLLFHPAHIQKEGVAESLLGAVALGKAKGLQWWTAKSIALWEEARRGVQWSAAKNCVTLTAGQKRPLQSATLLTLAPPQARLLVNGHETDCSLVERWGFHFHCVVLDIEANESVHLEIAP